MPYHIMTHPTFIGDRPELAEIDLSKLPEREYFTPNYAKDKGPYRTRDPIVTNEVDYFETANWQEELSICRLSGEISFLYSDGYYYVFPLTRYRLVRGGCRWDYWVEDTLDPDEFIPVSIEKQVNAIKKEVVDLKTSLQQLKEYNLELEKKIDRLEQEMKF